MIEKRREFFQELIAAILVIISLIGVPLLIKWYETYYFISQYGSNAKIFKLTATAVQGRVTLERVVGYNYWSGRFRRCESIDVNKGDKVVLVIKSADVTHSFEVKPDIGIEQPIEMEGGHTKIVDFIAEKSGAYLFECKSFCGCTHHGIFFTLNIADDKVK